MAFPDNSMLWQFHMTMHVSALAGIMNDSSEMLGERSCQVLSLLKIEKHVISRSGEAIDQIRITKARHTTHISWTIEKRYWCQSSDSFDIVSWPPNIWLFHNILSLVHNSSALFGQGLEVWVYRMGRSRTVWPGWFFLTVSEHQWGCIPLDVFSKTISAVLAFHTRSRGSFLYGFWEK